MRNVWILVASALLAFANFVKAQETSRNLYSSRIAIHSTAASKSKYKQKYLRYDNLDIDTILGSSRLVNNYVDCLLSRKPCPPEGKDLKRILPEALRTKCSRCSTTQKENALKIITTLYYNYPEQYQALRDRWDQSGEYHRRFEEYLRGLQFNQIGSNGNDRPVRIDFDRDQSQVLLQTLILSTTTPPPPLPSSSTTPNAIPSVPEQRPPQQLAPSAQLTQSVAPVSITSTTTTTTIDSSTASTAIPTTTTTTTTTITTSTPTTSAATATTGTAPNTTSGSSDPSSNVATAESSQAPGTVAPMENPRPTVGVLVNRFGDDGSTTSDTVEFVTTVRPTVRPTARPPVIRQTTSRVVTPKPTPNRFGGLPANPNASPFVGLFNQIGNKLATTADVLAGMFRRTVDVLVSTHLQTHQPQQRSIRNN